MGVLYSYLFASDQARRAAGEETLRRPGAPCLGSTTGDAGPSAMGSRAKPRVRHGPQQPCLGCFTRSLNHAPG